MEKCKNLLKLMIRKEDLTAAISRRIQRPLFAQDVKSSWKSRMRIH